MESGIKSAKFILMKAEENKTFQVLKDFPQKCPTKLKNAQQSEKGMVSKTLSDFLQRIECSIDRVPS